MSRTNFSVVQATCSESEQQHTLKAKISGLCSEAEAYVLFMLARCATLPASPILAVLT